VPKGVRERVPHWTDRSPGVSLSSQ